MGIRLATTKICHLTLYPWYCNKISHLVKLSNNQATSQFIQNESYCRHLPPSTVTHGENTIYVFTLFPEEHKTTRNLQVSINPETLELLVASQNRMYQTGLQQISYYNQTTRTKTRLRQYTKSMYCKT